MAKVRIPFKTRFKMPLLLGQKTWTSRTKKMGKAGDWFEVFGAAFKITEVVIKQLETVLLHYQEEGCKSKDDFINAWCEIHPIKGFDGTQKVYVHVFRRIA